MEKINTLIFWYIDESITQLSKILSEGAFFSLSCVFTRFFWRIHNANVWKLEKNYVKMHVDKNYIAPSEIFYHIGILILQSDSHNWCRKGRFGYNWRRFQFKGAIWRYTVWVLTTFWMKKIEMCDYNIPVLFFRISIFFIHRVYFVMKIEYISFLITFEFCRVFQKSMHPMSWCMIRQWEFCRKAPGSLHIIKWVGLPTTFMPLKND